MTTNKVKENPKNGNGKNGDAHCVEYQEYLATLTDEERKIIRETKSLRNGEMNVTPEERKLFEEFRKVL